MWLRWSGVGIVVVDEAVGLSIMGCDLWWRGEEKGQDTFACGAGRIYRWCMDTGMTNAVAMDKEYSMSIVPLFTSLTTM